MMKKILTRRLRMSVVAGCAALFGMVSSAVAQEDSPPNGDESKAPAQNSNNAPPSLDELLGIEEAGDEQNTANQTAIEQQEKELQQLLAEKELDDAFKAAIDKMQLSAELLDVRYDSGLGTQRLQEEILAGLDQILDQAKKMMQQSSQSSSSSAQQQKQQQQQTPGPQQQNQNQQSQRDENSRTPQESNALEPPGLRQGDINTVIEESRIEWGTLPERVREELLQGRQEKFSSIYDRLTREYYKRLAEDSSP